MNETLFPHQATRRRVAQELAVALEAADQRVRQGPVTPDFDRERFDAELGAFDFDHPIPIEQACGWVIAQLEHGVVHMTHPQYLGLFNPAPSFPARCADQITAAFNPQLATATTSPAAVAMEAHVIRAWAARAGLPPGSAGHFTSGGSEANGAALACALTRAEPGFATRGARAFGGSPVFYISADSHLAWIKLAHLAGVGRDAARLVPTDSAGRMSIEALEHLIAADRAAGHIPVMVVATAGTTNAGAIDPIDACHRVAREAGAWFHVDAAWGGALLASDRFREMLSGIEHADSIIIDAHKWLATTMGCGMFITARPDLLAATFDVRTSFMPSHSTAVDPYVTTAQWSRRFGGLRLFLSLATAGWAGHAAHVEEGVRLGRAFARDMAARGWAIANDPAMAVICVEPPHGSVPVADIVAAVLRSGLVWVSAARFAGHDVVRACITHGETAEAHLEVAASALDACRLGVAPDRLGRRAVPVRSTDGVNSISD